MFEMCITANQRALPFPRECAKARGADGNSLLLTSTFSVRLNHFLERLNILKIPFKPVKLSFYCDLSSQCLNIFQYHPHSSSSNSSIVFRSFFQDLPWHIFKITTLYYVCLSAHQLSCMPWIRGYNQIIPSCKWAGSQTKGALLVWTSCPFKLSTKPHFPWLLSPRAPVLLPVGLSTCRSWTGGTSGLCDSQRPRLRCLPRAFIAEAVNHCTHAIRHIQ